MFKTSRFSVLLVFLLTLLVVGCSDDAEPDRRGNTNLPNNDHADVGDLVDSSTGDTGDDWDTDDDAHDGNDMPDTDSDTGQDSGPDADVGPFDPPELEQRAWIVGHSTEGRPIVAEQYGVRGPVLYLLSAIHGNERSSVTFAERVRVPLQGGLAERMGLRIFFIGAGSPDGIAHNTRRTVNNVDPNRNFPAANFGGSTGGPYPLSEPEALAIHDTILAVDPTAILSLHCCAPTMDWDGPGEELARIMGGAAGFPAFTLGAANGSLGSWAGVDNGIPTITVEFAPQEHTDTDEQMWGVEAAIEAAAQWVIDNGEEGNIFIPDAIEEYPSSLYTAYDLAHSAGGLPIRAERLGEETAAPVLLLSGLAHTDRRALNVAEHIRRILLSELNIDEPSAVIITSANPDAQVSETSQNANGDNVATNFALEQGPDTPEGQALADLIASSGFRFAILVEDDDTEDNVQAFGLAEALLEEFVDAQLSLNSGDDATLPEGSVARFLRDQDIPVLRFGVRSVFAMGDTRQGRTFDDIEVFSRTARNIITSDIGD